VNILGVSAVAMAFGSRAGDSNWNSIAEFDKNGVIDILDIFAIASDYGKTT
jgi:hypothetical protein